jgi:hypothetical protein
VEPILISARYQIPSRGAWGSLGFGVLFVVAGVKLLVVDHAGVGIAAYPLLPGMAAIAWFVLSYLDVGHLEVTASTIRGISRFGGAFEVPTADIATVKMAGSRKFDTRMLRLIRRDGSEMQLRRVKPESIAGELHRLCSAAARPTGV